MILKITVATLPKSTSFTRRMAAPTIFLNLKHHAHLDISFIDHNNQLEKILTVVLKYVHSSVIIEDLQLKFLALC